MTSLAHIFKLERAQQHKEALRLCLKLRKASKAHELSRLNLDLIEARLSQRLGSSLSASAGSPKRRRRADRQLLHNFQAERRFSSGMLSTNSWSAIVCLWKRKAYLHDQLLAIRQQTLPPREIICLINDHYFSPEEVSALREEGCRIVHSDINSLYNRWALAYLCSGDYVCIFDDDTIPGASYVEHAIACCRGYNCIVGASGRLYDTAGLHGYYKLVEPQARDANFVACASEDILCDWVCNSYLFKREWVPAFLKEQSFMDSFTTHDDLQMAMSAYQSLGIGCVVPHQPPQRPELAASQRPEYGQDEHAVYITHQDRHFATRRAYLQDARKSRAFLPAKHRNKVRFHIVIPFASRKGLEWCLRSVIAQNYTGYTLYLVDDCCDGRVDDTLGILADLGVPADRFILAQTLQKAYPLGSRCVAYGLMEANHSDVVIHLDADDFLARADVLQILAKIYACSDIKLTHGGSVTATIPAEEYCAANHSVTTTFGETWRSSDWCFNHQAPTRKLVKQGQISDSVTVESLRDLPWGHMHLRSHRYHLWASLPKEHFLYEGKPLRAATDMAIFLPMLLMVQAPQVKHLENILHVYTRHPQGTTTDDVVSAETKNLYIEHILKHLRHPDSRTGASGASVASATFPVPFTVVEPANDSSSSLWRIHKSDAKHASPLFDVTEYTALDYPPTPESSRLAIFTIVTADHVADGILAVESMRQLGRIHGEAIVFVADPGNALDPSTQDFAARLNIKLKLASDLTAEDSKDMLAQLLSTYQPGSDEFRWSMKSVLATELLLCGYSQAVFTDPDTLTVAPMADVFARAAQHGLFLFPHFRHYDCEWSRRTLYSDGFYNGGLFSCTPAGLRMLSKWFQRCARRMDRSTEDHTFVDQKYLDTAPYEDFSVGYNLDRGINFNTWNTERIHFLAPSMVSYLLECGRFVRHWHFTQGMIDGSLKGYNRHTLFDPSIVRYLALRLAVLVLLRHSCSLEAAQSCLDHRIASNADMIRLLNDKLPKDRGWRRLEELGASSFAPCDTDYFMDSFVWDGPLFEFHTLVGALVAASQLPTVSGAPGNVTHQSSNGAKKPTFPALLHEHFIRQTNLAPANFQHLTGVQRATLQELQSLGSDLSLRLHSASCAGFQADTVTWHHYDY